MENSVKYIKGKSSFISWILKRKRQKNNTLILVYGKTGSGKSRACLSLAHQLDESFDVRQVVFNFGEMMEVINSDWFKQKEIKQIVFEETQTSLNARTWASVINRLINHLLSTFRATQIIVWFNAPYKDFLDSQSMKLIHATLETRGIDRNANKCRLHLSIEQYNSDIQKYYHHPLCVLRDGSVKKLREISVSQPPTELDKAYEDKKKAFNDRTNLELLAKIRNIENKDKPKSEQIKDNKKPLTEMQQKVMELYKEHGTLKKVAEILNISIPTACIHIRNAKFKGYSLEKGGFEPNLANLDDKPTEEAL